MATATPSYQILVVDDDYDLRETLAEFLALEGYAVRCASNGRQAMDVIRRERPAVILLDMNMPAMDGREFRSRQTRDPDIADIPVIVMSAGDVDLERPPTGTFIPKPFNPDVLLRTIERYC
jgi:CheY-like chemotaxis protein